MTCSALVSEFPFFLISSLFSFNPRSADKEKKEEWRTSGTRVLIRSVWRKKSSIIEAQERIVIGNARSILQLEVQKREGMGTTVTSVKKNSHGFLETTRRLVTLWWKPLFGV